MLGASTATFADPSIEADVRRLYDQACCGGEHILRTAEHPRDVLADPSTRTRFFKAAHAGFDVAQREILGRMLALEKDTTGSRWKRATECVLRKIMDAMAWQILSGQLYIARRMYRDHRQPRLSESNIHSVAVAAAAFREKNDAAFALISDLTSFIQIGDLLVFDPAKGLTIVEVKEGAKNKKILDFANFFLEAQCEASLHYSSRQEGPKAFEQLGRIFRQGERMSYVASVLSKGKGIDPDTKETVVVPDKPLEIDNYDEILSDLLEEAGGGKTWAINIVDDCLFIGAYRGVMLRASSVAFKTWFYGTGAREGCPVINQLQSMTNPLALPIFNRCLKPEQKFDLLFGRSTLLLALDLDRFRTLAVASGVSLRWGTRKEAARMGGGVARKGAVSIGDQVLIAEKGESRLVIYDGLIARIILHGTTPRSAVGVIRRSLEEQTDDVEPADGV